MTRPRTPTRPAGETYESLFEQDALFEFSKVINSSLDLSFILSHVLLTIMGKILSARGIVLLADGNNRYRVEMVKGFPGEMRGQEITVRNVSRSLFDVNRLDARRAPWIKFFREAGVGILLPIFVVDRPIGLLGFGARLSRKGVHKREKQYLQALANIAATAIEKCHTIEEVKGVNRKLDLKIQELNTLFDLSKEFGALLDADKLARLLVFTLLGQVGVNRYLICLKEGADMRTVASRIDGASPQGEFLAEVARTKAPVRLEDFVVKQSPRSGGQQQDPRDTLAAMGMKVIVPMLLQGESKGVILLGEKLSREPFSLPDLEFLESLANLAIISLENARLFKQAIEKQKMEDELLIAREIQKGLLPSVLPEIPGIDIAATNISSKQVGGDYYDVIHVDDHGHIIAIGDVSGKGSPAALLMANLQATIRALVPLSLPLAELTNRVNDLMCENTGGNKFVTFFWGYLDHDARSLRYVNAGHNYPYLFHPDGSVERLDRGGMILGIMKVPVPYEEASVRLGSGDLLVLFTDGVSEAMSKESEEYGEERLESMVRTHAHQAALEIMDAVHRDILQFTKGAQQSDDITMMVIKVA